MRRDDVTILRRSHESVLSQNKVLRNTYILLSATFLWSSLIAAFTTSNMAAIYSAVPYLFHPIALIVGMYGLMFLTQALRNSMWGLVSIFAFTGFMGLTLGPILSLYLGMYSNGPQIVMTALGATGIIFFALSGYVMTTRKDFSYLGGFLFVGVMLALLAMIASIFFSIPGLTLAISALFVLISSGLILFQTSLIINGGEQNYIMATISLYVALYNLFISLLQLLGAFGGRD